jgi:hypothetical protein
LLCIQSQRGWSSTRLISQRRASSSRTGVRSSCLRLCYLTSGPPLLKPTRVPGSGAGPYDIWPVVGREQRVIQRPSAWGARGRPASRSLSQRSSCGRLVRSNEAADMVALAICAGLGAGAVRGSGSSHGVYVPVPPRPAGPGKLVGQPEREREPVCLYGGEERTR